MTRPRRAAVVRALRLLVIFVAVFALSEVITDGFDIGTLLDALGRGVLYGLFAAVIFFLLDDRHGAREPEYAYGPSRGTDVSAGETTRHGTADDSAESR